MTKTYEQFAQDLRQSSDHVFRIARWAHDRGYAVYIPPVILRPPHEPPSKYMDDGDLHVTKDGVCKKMNVKCSYKTDFTDTYWPYPGCLVTPKRVHDLCPDISTYITVHPTKNYAAIMDVEETFSHWTIKRYYDRVYKKEVEMYYCPKEFLKLHKF